MAMAAFDAVTMPNEVVLAWPLRGWSAWNAILRARLAHLERLPGWPTWSGCAKACAGTPRLTFRALGNCFANIPGASPAVNSPLRRPSSGQTC
jgi:hypothetical protein